MSHLRLTAFVLCLLAPVTANAADGGVYLYLQPLPAAAASLTFTLATVSAVTAAGSETTLKIALRTVGQPDAGRQRLLASGRLPVGSYAGFALRIKQASAKSERGDAALTVPDAAVRVDAPFVVTSQHGTLFWLTLNAGAAGADFNPTFSAVTPARPIPDHAGFVTSTTSSSITVFDKTLMQAAAVIDTCATPAGMALDTPRRRVYVACSKDDEVQAIDVSTGEVLERSRLSPGDRPRELALTPDGTALLSVNTGSNSVSFFDASSLTRQDRVNVGSGPSSILIDPSGRRAFVFNTLSSAISVIDLSARTSIATLSTDASPLRGQFNGRGDRLYVIHERSPYMTVLDPQQLSVVTRVRMRMGTSAIAVDRVRDLVCVGSRNDPLVEFYDPNALMPLYAMRTPAGVSYMTIVATDNTLFMVSPDTRSLVVGRLADRKVASQIDVGDAPYWVAVMGER